MDVKLCPDVTTAPIPTGGCCPSFKAWKAAGNRSLIIRQVQIERCLFVIAIGNLSDSLDSRLSRSNPSQSSTTATSNINLEIEQ
jgi:hypothetical protein